MMNRSTFLYAISFLVLAICLYFVFRPDNQSVETIEVRTLNFTEPHRQTTNKPTVWDVITQNRYSTTVSNEKLAQDTLKELANSNSPEDKFKSYKILEKCFRDAQQLRRLSTISNVYHYKNIIDQMMPILERSKKYCADVSYSDMIHRFDLLNVALEAKIPGAAVAFSYEGPNGDLNLLVSPNAPEVIAWRNKANAYLETAAYAGERDALIELYMHHFDAPTKDSSQFLKAYTYLLALDRANQFPTYLDKQKASNTLQSALSPSQITQAEKAAEEFLKTAAALHP